MFWEVGRLQFLHNVNLLRINYTKQLKILLTGTTGYIGQRLLPVLLEKGHEVVCCVRDKNRFSKKNYNPRQFSLLEVDFLDEKSLEKIPADIDIAYYLIHSMSANIGNFEEMEERSARNF
jgi:uncharacterized protein YbjT (DUF2867 family)